MVFSVGRCRGGVPIEMTWVTGDKHLCSGTVSSGQKKKVQGCSDMDLDVAGERSSIRDKSRYVTKDQLIVLFEREDAENVEKIMDLCRLSSELRAAVKRRDGYIVELRLYRSCDDTLRTIEMLSHMQFDVMEKVARMLLMARETHIKVDEKNGFIMRMRNRAVV
uniref:Uncharacterized protein n=1 Tax=Tanacetum cinerariifolium TaxID=118510 RepID=A0A6L2KPA8_TANCI|nr:hypothetical protein [Tanacetum cinerariifolium]